MQTVLAFRLACRVAGLPPHKEPDSAQVVDALNCAQIVRVAFVWRLDLDQATVGDIPDGPDRDLIAGLAGEYGCPVPQTTRLCELMGRMEQAPLVRFCGENELDPSSQKGMALFAADAVALTDTELSDSPPLLAWLEGQGISTVGRLGAQAANLQPARGAGAAGTGFRRRVRTFLSTSTLTKDIVS